MKASPDLPDSAVFDTHVHVFRRGEGLVEGRRYTPGHDALPETLLAKMASSGIDRAILVQPSFLGTDNRFLLSAIEDHPGRFHGVAVTAPDLPESALAELKARGVVGIRLNLIGLPVDDFASRHGGLVAALARQDMVLEIQAEGVQWQTILPVLEQGETRVLIDHFGRTAPGASSRGFEALLAAAVRNSAFWFKVSAPYRLAPGMAARCAERLVGTLGVDRIVWGSDWPATQFEGRHDYADTLSWLEEWIPDAEARQQVLARNPGLLYRFATIG